MDFGMVGLNGFVSSENGFNPQVSETRQKGYGSGFLKQERSGLAEDDWRSLKMARTDDLSASKPMLLHQRTPTLLRSNFLFPDGHHQPQMLSFSSSKSEALLSSNDVAFAERGLPNAAFPYYLNPSSSYTRSTGLGSGSLNTSMHGILTGVRGPFTPSQWMELEHQALIYKYITANVPIPSNLLIPIRKALNPSGYTCLSAGSLRPNTLGWGSFHLGFSGNTDPEPGRCRRTDGKKWRCSRDAVADQKYCERHMNRGRHRSRKPVEGQTGHAVSGPVKTKVMPMASSSSASAISVDGASNSLTMAQHHQIKNLQPGAAAAANPSAVPLINRALPPYKENLGDHRMQDPQGLSMLSPTKNLNLKDTLFSVPRQQNPFEYSSHSHSHSRAEFGLLSSNSLLNSARRGGGSDSHVSSSRNFGSSSSTDLNDRDPQAQQHHPLRHFIDDWPGNRSDRSTVAAWPELEEIQSDRTQLSISIPVSSSDFSSSSSPSPTPTQEKLNLSPLRLSREFDDPIQMGLGVGSILNEPTMATQRHMNWIPIPWETSMGGPLAEVLKNTNNNNNNSNRRTTSTTSATSAAGDRKGSPVSALNLMTETWDGSPRLGSSPTGVLQKATFGSLSNSSSGSSPRAENSKTHDGFSLCDDLVGSTLVNSSSIHSL
ncbi:growth-regulating factor 1-like [Telopea speciosissima]|uniref:growth-regulating factor 1-like n=1 Tax=Telopea speciosissima TaxID=54955 RepID=UPI001CC57F5E|nr:growth-regulating factor 1-like [Telopea speciosissima]